MLFLIVFLIPYGNTPDWESNSGYFATGGALVDINLDDYPDFVVSNGNDMEQEVNAVYLGNGNSFSSFPDWVSSDARYSGHLSVIDFDRDGDFDLAVSNYLGSGGFSTPGNVVLYLNNGGALSPSPVWSSKDSTWTFSCDFGDIDGDGYPELAIAGGESYYGNPETLKIHKNRGNSLDSLPFWKSNSSYFAYDVLFYDVNLDGWLDLIVACEGEPNLIFFNQDGVLENTPSWQSIEIDGSIQLDAGDLDENGYPDLVFANNAQLGGISSIRIYWNFNGFPETQAGLTLDSLKNYYSTVALADVDGDNDLDIGAGGWWEPLVVFENLGGTFNFTPDWEWSPSNPQDLVCEKVTFSELNRSSVINSVDTFIIYQKIPAFTLKNRPVISIDSVTQSSNGIPSPIPESAFTYHQESAILMVDTSFLLPGTLRVEVYYKFPLLPDITVTNWEQTRGNFLFLNTGISVAEERESLKTPISPPLVRTINKNTLWISEGIQGKEVSIYDITGRRVFLILGKRTIHHNLNSGIYFISIEGKRALRTVIIQ